MIGLVCVLLLCVCVCFVQTRNVHKSRRLLLLLPEEGFRLHICVRWARGAAALRLGRFVRCDDRAPPGRWRAACHFVRVG